MTDEPKAAHHHHHHHHHIDRDTGDAKIAGAVVVNLALTLAQVIGGILSGSLALIADALHNFSDAVALIIAFWARRIARKLADRRMSFGYGRAEVVAALVNYTTLIVLALYLIYEGVLRFLNPEPIDGWIVVWIAVLALAVDLVTAALTYTMSKESMNIRAAFLHNLADALGSVAVIVTGTVVIVYGWTWVDALATLLIAGYILWHVKVEIGAVVAVLMLGSPPHLDLDEVVNGIEAIDGVDDVHHIHLWMMQEHDISFDAHLVIAEGHWQQGDQIKHQVKTYLASQFLIKHSTLELECSRHACAAPAKVGHRV